MPIALDYATVYQAIVDVTDGRVVAAEALVRGSGGAGASEALRRARSRRRGMLELTEVVMEAACASAASAGLPVHVNIDPTTLDERGKELVSLIRRALSAADLAPELLAVEVTEDVGGDQRVGQTLHELHDLGVRLAIDDFGAGAAGLHRLATLPVDAVKVDRSVLVAAMSSQRGRSVLRSLVSMLAEHEWGCVIEGVETPEQASLLEHLAEHHAALAAQGWFYGRPADAFPGTVAQPTTRQEQA